MITTEKLLQLKQTVDNARTKSTEFKGELKGHMTTLLETWGCSDDEAGRKKSEEMQKELKKLNTKLEEYSEELELNYEL